MVSALPFGMGEEGRLLIPPCRRSFGRRSPVFYEFEERRLSCVRRCLLLLAAKFEKVTPQKAFALDLDKSLSGHVLAFRAWVPAQARAL